MTDTRSGSSASIVERLRQIERAGDLPPRGHVALAKEAAAEIERLRAYAKHEFSLGAEGPMIELTNARQEIERLTAENAELRAALQIWMQGRTLEQTHDQTQGQK